MEILLMAGYFDDIRDWCACMRFGVGFVVVTVTWEWTAEAYEEDLRLQREGETRDARMIRILMPLINSINQDLVFTAEVPGDFANGRLPTLDFEVWQDGVGRVNHHY